MCPENEWSLAESNECSKCPDGKLVGEGAGTKESDCKWGELLLTEFMFDFKGNI